MQCKPRSDSTALPRHVPSLGEKTVALLVLIGPFSAIPIYLSAAQALSAEALA